MPLSIFIRAVSLHWEGPIFLSPIIFLPGGLLSSNSGTTMTVGGKFSITALAGHATISHPIALTSGRLSKERGPPGKNFGSSSKKMVMKWGIELQSCV